MQYFNRHKVRAIGRAVPSVRPSVPRMTPTVKHLSAALSITMQSNCSRFPTIQRKPLQLQGLRHVKKLSTYTLQDPNLIRCYIVSDPELTLFVTSFGYYIGRSGKWQVPPNVILERYYVTCAGTGDVTLE